MCADIQVHVHVACVHSYGSTYWAMSAVNLLSVKSMEEMAMAELKYCWKTGATGAAVPFLQGMGSEEGGDGGWVMEVMVGGLWR